MPVAHLLVGLPGSGKTTLARRLETHGALRLTPDEWMVPLFGTSHPDERRDVLEGRLVQVGLRSLELGVDVVLDFGLWSRDERTALRWLTAAVGATATVHSLAVDGTTQRARLDDRRNLLRHTTFEFTDADLAVYRTAFQEPDAGEMTGAPLDESPAGSADWCAWAAQRWPSLAPPGGASAGSR